jgi:hypothetical protein
VFDLLLHHWPMIASLTQSLLAAEDRLFSEKSIRPLPPRPRNDHHAPHRSAE